MAIANQPFRDEEGDHIDSDTPRSGFATPQPDLSDKRLPGIMHSYFGQVGTGSSSNPSHLGRDRPSFVAEPRNSLSSQGKVAGEVHSSQMVSPKNGSISDNTEFGDSPPLLPHERTGLLRASERSQMFGSNPYPTPPASHPPSLHKLNLNESSSECDASGLGGTQVSSAAVCKSISDSIPPSARRASVMNPLSSVVTASNVHAAHFSNPSNRYPSSTPITPADSRMNSYFFAESSSYEQLKKLTDNSSPQKSNSPTPRALSNQTAKSDASGGSDQGNGRTNNGHADTTSSQSSSGSGAVPVSTPRGKLTVKILEARGLRRCRDPYVVAVFQRNELVSKGPRIEDEEEDEEMNSIPRGGIPISRQGSDSGRPMAIPMKSRQSSNTSLSEYRDFKSKSRRSFTNPKWDTEAVL